MKLSMNFMSSLSKGFSKLTTKVVPTTSAAAKPLSMNPLGDGASNLAKHLSGPKQDLVSLTSKTAKTQSAAAAPFRRTSPAAAPSTPPIRQQPVKPQSTSAKPAQKTTSPMDLDNDPLFKAPWRSSRGTRHRSGHQSQKAFDCS